MKADRQENRVDVAPYYASGIVMGVILSGLIFEVSEGKPMLDIVREYQTLIAGVLALLGAVFTVRKIGQQIHQSEVHQKDLIERNFRAAKSVLPLALSELHQYSSRCLSLAIAMVDRQDNVGKYPDISADVLPTFKEVIKFAEPEHQESLACLISQFQIQHSRLHSAFEEYNSLIPNDSSKDDKLILRKRIQGGNEYALDLILDAENLLFQTSDLFEFARGEFLENQQAEHQERRMNVFESKLARNNVRKEKWPRLYERAEQRYGAVQ